MTKKPASLSPIVLSVFLTSCLYSADAHSNSVKLRDAENEVLCERKTAIIQRLVAYASTNDKKWLKQTREKIATIDEELVRRGLDRRHCEGGSFATAKKNAPRKEPKGESIAGYLGTSKDGEPHGFGRVNYTNGTAYRGEWKFGKPHGLGTFVDSSGLTMIGSFSNGQADGPFVLTTDRTETHGVFVDGLLQGEVTIYAKDGRVMRATYKDNNMLRDTLKNVPMENDE